MNEIDVNQNRAKWFFLILIFGTMIMISLLTGCGIKYGKTIHCKGETCERCKQELCTTDSRINRKGVYFRKCIECGAVYKYRLGKEIK